MSKASVSSPDAESEERNFLAVSELLFDPQNPRLAELGLSKTPTQPEILKALWQSMAVDEVAWSIAKNGFFSYEPLFVEIDAKSKRKYVIEGNRRLAAVKLLLDKRLRDELEATDLPHISPSRATSLQNLPVIFSTRKKVNYK